MKIRQIIISLIGILIILGALWYKGILAATERPRPKKVKRPVPTVFVQTVKNGSTPITVRAAGTLEARDRVDLFSEVQGIFDYSAGSFKAGTIYKSGAVLLRINSDEAQASLRAQKSTLFNQILALLPDLKFDYPESSSQWENYINNFSEDKPLQALPQPINEKEKLFIAGRNINSTWYNIKNLEERIAKYTIYAPYSGILTEASVNKGTLVRPGQKLGTFINPTAYELPVAINSNYANLLKVGNTVELHNAEQSQTWQGRVIRLNSLVDPNTQTVQAYIQVTGKALREGMYLEADLTAKEEAHTFEVSRQLLTDNNKLYFVKDSTLQLASVSPVYFNENTVVVRDLPDGMHILKRPVPGAYSGMQVQTSQE